MPNESIPFDYFNVQQVGLLLEVGENDLANYVAETTSKDAVEMLDYYIERGIYNRAEIQQKLYSLNNITRAYRANRMNEEAAKYEEMFNKYYKSFQNN